MRILVQSDVHIEFHSDQGAAFADTLSRSADSVDALVLAGDIGTKTCLVPFLNRVCKDFEHVIYVTGNHEYYGSSPVETHRALAGCVSKNKNLHWLNNQAVTIKGQRFLGGSLWFPDAPMNYLYKRGIADFSHIGQLEPWVYAQRDGMLSLLRTAVADDVVVTHHIPHQRFVTDYWRGSTLNRFFVGDVPDHLLAIPKLWIYGHTHDSTDETMEWGGRFVCNPYGYKGHSVNYKHVPYKVIDTADVTGKNQSQLATEPASTGWDGL